VQLLIVIVVMALIIGIVIAVINPGKRFGEINDSERKTESEAILNAIYQYQTSTGELPKCLYGTIPAPTDIPECDGEENGNFDGAIELGTPPGDDTYDCSTILIPVYLQEMPTDPKVSRSEKHSGYYICQNTTEALPIVYIIDADAEVSTDGNCQIPGTTDPAMCVTK